jgi:hypothetical protein
MYMIKVVFLAKFNQKIVEPDVNALSGVNKPSFPFLGLARLNFT